MENLMNDILDNMMESEKKRQKVNDINKLESQNYNLLNECGSCYKWMTSMCDREKNHKVSCVERICNDFVITKFSDEFVNNNKFKINELKAQEEKV